MGVVNKPIEELVGSCSSFCNINGAISRMGVFTSVEGEGKDNPKRIYFCGLGKRDCLMVYFAQKFNEVAPKAYAVSQQFDSSLPPDLMRF